MTVSQSAHPPGLSYLTQVGELVASMIIVWAFAVVGLSAGLLWLGVSLTGWALWIGLAVTLAAGRQLAPTPDMWRLATWGLMTATLVGGGIFEWIYDLSGDGQQYHLPAILALADGWNPFHQPELGAWRPEFASSVTTGIYIEHYAKGAWLLAAATYRATGLLEAAKVWNLLYLIAVALVARAALGRLGLSPAWSWGLALATAANPVVVYQLTSFYVDGQLASLFSLLLLFSACYLWQGGRTALLLATLCLALLINIKFTGLVYGVALSAGLCLAAWAAKLSRARVYALACVTATLFALLVIGWQPYVTNTVQKGHPFYPAVGREDGQNVQWRSAPPAFLAQHRAEKLVRSLYARSSGSRALPQWKIPFSVDRGELFAFFTPDARYGGFGPWFGGVLAASLLLALFARSGRSTLFVFGMAGWMVLTSLLNPEAWWARLSPQIWLVAPLCLLLAARSRVAWVRQVGAGLIGVLLLNTLLVAGLNGGRALEKNLVFRSQLTQLKSVATPALHLPVGFRLVTTDRLDRLDIAYRVPARLTCAQPKGFSFPEAAGMKMCVAAEP